MSFNQIKSHLKSVYNMFMYTCIHDLIKYFRYLIYFYTSVMSLEFVNPKNEFIHN